jgi:signal transduction histidine kinase
MSQSRRAPGVAPPRSGVQVLIVDDEENLRLALAQAFKLEGYRVTPAATAQEAIEAMRAAPCEVVITDLMLPDMDGIALTERARLMQPGALVVLMTGQGTIDSAVKALKGGAYDYILKPFRLEELFVIVARGLEQQRLRQENIQLSEINRRLYELDQIRSDLLSAITHEFRTPLTIINGWVDLLLGQHLGGLTPDQQESVVAVKQGAQRLGRLIGNLLAYVEFERGEINLQAQEVHLPELLRSVVHPFEPEIKERGLTVHFDLEAEIPTLWLDPEKVGLLFANLIENGIKFNERHGQLRVAAGMISGDLEVGISNTGTPIPADGIAKLMQPFIQGDMSMTRSAGGLGLGLAVARVIVDAYRGQIAIESGMGGGTTVRVRLPLRASRPAPVGGA